LHALVGVSLCNFFYFFDSFIENLHIECIEIVIPFAIFICFFDWPPSSSSASTKK
jgi:hypothetical protein